MYASFGILVLSATTPTADPEITTMKRLRASGGRNILERDAT
jgi:hypothetical protein